MLPRAREALLESTPMQRTRIASVAYLNALPLTWGLTRGSLTDGYIVTAVPPCDAAGLLVEGRVDVALIPSIEFARTTGLTACPGTGIAADREVRSVLLLSRVAPEAIRSCAVDRNSRTSVALLRLVLRHRHGSRPDLEAMPPDAEFMLRAHDAALVIGDPALAASVRPPRGVSHVIDLAREWNAMTGLPFVFAIWACRPVVPVAALSDILERSLDEGLAHIDTMAEEESRRTGLEPGVIASYLRDALRYRLGPAETRSLRLFFGMCGEEGLVDRYARPASSRMRSAAVNRG